MTNTYSKCPICGNENWENILGDDIEKDDEQVWQDYQCLECGFTWKEVYTFSHNETIDTNKVLDEYGNIEIVNKSELKLFRISTETRDGEHEYTQEQLIVATSIEEVEKYAKDFMEDYWGEDTEKTDMYGTTWYQTACGDVMSKLDCISEIRSFSVPDVNGNRYQFTVNLQEDGSATDLQ